MFSDHHRKVRDPASSSLGMKEVSSTVSRGSSTKAAYKISTTYLATVPPKCFFCSILPLLYCILFSRRLNRISDSVPQTRNSSQLITQAQETI